MPVNLQQLQYIYVFKMIAMKNILLLILIFTSLKAFSQKEKQPMDWPNLKKYAQENQALANKTNKGRIVWMGDSITELWKMGNSTFFQNELYVNRGIGGQTTLQMLLRFRQDVLDLKPEIVVILAGINDIAENTGPISLENIMGNIISMAELAKANNIKVVLSSVLPANAFPWRPDIQPAEKVIALNVLIKKYCQENNIVYIDYYSKMANAQKGLDFEIANDGVHPTLSGYKIMEPLVLEALKKASKN